MVAVSLTQEECTASIFQSGQARHYSIADMWRLRFETREGMTGRWSQYHQKGDIREVRTFEELWTTSAMSIPRVGCVPSVF